MDIEEHNGPLYTFYVDVHDRSRVECPHCGLQRTMDVTRYKQVRRALKIKCRCGKNFLGFFEFRRYYRKRVDLDGVYENVESQEGGRMIVDTLSLDGVGFAVTGPHRIRQGDILAIRFELDDSKRTRIERKVRVMSVREQAVGSQFTRRKELDPDLGFYLME